MHLLNHEVLAILNLPVWCKALDDMAGLHLQHITCFERKSELSEKEPMQGRLSQHDCVYK